MPYCPTCGKESASGFYCGFCGNPLAQIFQGSEELAIEELTMELKKGTLDDF